MGLGLRVKGSGLRANDPKLSENGRESNGQEDGTCDGNLKPCMVGDPAGFFAVGFRVQGLGVWGVGFQFCTGGFRVL